MYKIAILGTENSHAAEFTKLLLNFEEFSDIKLYGVYGYDSTANDKIKELYGDIKVAEKPEDFLGEVDGVVITARHGNHHYEYGLPYAKAGVPMFIDKPFTVRKDYALELIAEAKKSGAPLCGGSSLKFCPQFTELRDIVNDASLPLGKIIGGSVAAPVSLKNDYGDFFFYSQHLVAIMLEVFGNGVKSVLARGADDRVTFIARYDGFDVTGHFGTTEYSASLYGAKKTVLQKNDTRVTDLYRPEFREFADMLRSGVAPLSPKELITPLFILHAINDSRLSGEEVTVTVPEV